MIIKITVDIWPKWELIIVITIYDWNPKILKNTSNKRIEIINQPPKKEEAMPQISYSKEGMSIDEIEMLVDVMSKGKVKSEFDTLVAVAKSSGTYLYEDLEQKIKGSKENISTLLDTVANKVQVNAYSGKENDLFFSKLGFNIVDFLPMKFN